MSQASSSGQGAQHAAPKSGNKNGGTAANDRTAHDQSRSTELPPKVQQVAAKVAGASQHAATHFVQEPAQDLLGLAKQYVQEKPDVAAMWCFGLGIIVGWKLRG